MGYEFREKGKKQQACFGMAWTIQSQGKASNKLTSQSSSRQAGQLRRVYEHRRKLPIVSSKEGFIPPSKQAVRRKATCEREKGKRQSLERGVYGFATGTIISCSTSSALAANLAMSAPSTLPNMVSATMAVIWYGSPLEAGRRSSK